MAGGVLQKTRRLTVCAVLCALNLVVMYFGTIIEVLDLSAAVVASLACIFAVIEMGGSWPWLIYAVTGVLSLVLLPFPKTVALIYVAFSGYYPILKARIEWMRRPISWLVKLVLFNVALTVLVALSTWIFHIPDGLFEANVFVYLFGNVTFVVYDIALTGLITTYLRVWRKKFRIRFK
jgi:hypothetical protein